ncbi:MAG: hypothetical protein ACAF41_26990 [Leptolyngbya sp. BL-A-14]
MSGTICASSRGAGAAAGVVSRGKRWVETGAEGDGGAAGAEGTGGETLTVRVCSALTADDWLSIAAPVDEAALTVCTTRSRAIIGASGIAGTFTVGAGSGVVGNASGTLAAVGVAIPMGAVTVWAPVAVAIVRVSAVRVVAVALYAVTGLPVIPSSNESAAIKTLNCLRDLWGTKCFEVTAPSRLAAIESRPSSYV